MEKALSDRCLMRQCFFHITKQYRGGILKIEEAIKLLNGNSFDNKLTAINEQIQNIAQKKDTLCRRMYN